MNTVEKVPLNFEQNYRSTLEHSFPKWITDIKVQLEVSL